MLTAIDAWFGKNLFVPPIIKLCQVTRQTQFAISRTFWFAAALNGFYRAETIASSVIWGLMSLFMMITAVRRADAPALSMMWFRLASLAFLAFDVVTSITRAKWAAPEFWVLVLFAEYAATIRSIPPRDTKSRNTRAAPATQRDA
jgi:hypothetical protein